MCGNAGLRQLTGGYTPGPNAQEQQAMIDAPRLAQEAADAKAAQNSNSRLASRNRRVASSILATGAGTGEIQPLAGKTQLGA
jgi:hypothetical protein